MFFKRKQRHAFLLVIFYGMTFDSFFLFIFRWSSIFFCWKTKKETDSTKKTNHFSFIIPFLFFPKKLRDSMLLQRCLFSISFFIIYLFYLWQCTRKRRDYFFSVFHHRRRWRSKNWERNCCKRFSSLKKRRRSAAISFFVAGVLRIFFSSLLQKREGHFCGTQKYFTLYFRTVIFLFL